MLESSHEIDYLLWIFGKISSVSALLHNSRLFDIDVEDTDNLIMKSVGGTPILVHLDFNSYIYRRKCILRSSNGILSWNGINKTVNWYPNSKQEKVKKFSFDRNLIYRQQIEHFFDCIEMMLNPKFLLRMELKSCMLLMQQDKLVRKVL